MSDTCPRCGSQHMVTGTTTRKTRVVKSYFFWREESWSEQTESYQRCLDCGHEWSGEE